MTRVDETILWETPADVVEALYRVHPPRSNAAIIEPSCGRGAIAKVLLDRGHRVYGVEREARHVGILDELQRKDERFRFIERDWLQIQNPGASTAIIGNPPYRPASVMLLHMQQCLLLRRAFPQITYIALLLPASTFHSERRFTFWGTFGAPQGYYPLTPRVSFVSTGRHGFQDVAWFVWDSNVAERRIEVLWWQTTHNANVKSSTISKASSTKKETAPSGNAASQQTSWTDATSCER